MKIYWRMCRKKDGWTKCVCVKETEKGIRR